MPVGVFGRVVTKMSLLAGLITKMCVISGNSKEIKQPLLQKMPFYNCGILLSTCKPCERRRDVEDHRKSNCRNAKRVARHSLTTLNFSMVIPRGGDTCSRRERSYHRKIFQALFFNYRKLTLVCVD